MLVALKIENAWREHSIFALDDMNALASEDFVAITKRMACFTAAGISEISDARTQAREA